jgi:hypothetical protein
MTKGYISTDVAIKTAYKAQTSARGQNHRRDQYRYGAPSWRAVRVDDSAARGYVPRERDYQRGAYGHGGFTPLEISHRPLMK